MLDEHGRPAPDGSDGASPAGDASAAAASASSVAAPLPGRPDDGLQGAAVHALVVSHGAYIRVAVRHLVDDLESALPAGVKMHHLFSPCPNTGVTRFTLTLSRCERGPVLSGARCVFVNRKEHLKELAAAE